MTDDERLEPGDVPRLQTTILDITGATGDPGGLTFTMNEPDGTATEYIYGTNAQLVRDALGVFYVDWPITQIGTHRFSFDATGANASYKDSSFISYARRVVAA